MKLFLKEYQTSFKGDRLDVSFWSFLKCHILVSLVTTALLYGGLMVFFIIGLLGR